MLRDMGYEVRFEPMAREMLYIADELFFTGTAAEITPIRSVDRMSVGEGRRGTGHESGAGSVFWYHVRPASRTLNGWLTYVAQREQASGD
jgi:branched-chain amino acid aminotransferase